VQTLQGALRVDSENGDVHHALGLSLVRQQRLPEALAELAKATELHPDVPRYAYVYSIALREMGHIQQALQVLQDAHHRHPSDPQILVALADYSRQVGDRQAAIAWARKLVALSPGDVRAQRLLQSLEQQP
jgi:Flp pilus assembly protein TadD